MTADSFIAAFIFLTIIGGGYMLGYVHAAARFHRVLKKRWERDAQYQALGYVYNHLYSFSAAVRATHPRDAIVIRVCASMVHDGMILVSPRHDTDDPGTYRVRVIADEDEAETDHNVN